MMHNYFESMTRNQWIKWPCIILNRRVVNEGRSFIWIVETSFFYLGSLVLLLLIGMPALDYKRASMTNTFSPELGILTGSTPRFLQTPNRSAVPD